MKKNELTENQYRSLQDLCIKNGFDIDKFDLKTALWILKHEKLDDELTTNRKTKK